jgi:hypothetical protein
MAERTVVSSRQASIGRAISTDRRIIGAFNVPNGDFSNIPTLVAACNTGGRWIDGTAAGSTTNDTSRWATQLAINGGTLSIDPTVSYSSTGGSLLLSTNTITGVCRAGQVPQSLGTVTLQNFKYLHRVQPNTEYTIECYCKTVNAATNAAKLRIFQVKLNGAVTANDSNKLTGTNDWTKLTYIFTTSATTYYVEISPYFDAVGNVAQAWFDAITMVQSKFLPTMLAPLAQRVALRDAPDPENFGCNTHSSYSYFADMVDANIGWARIEFGWKYIEGTQGVYDWTTTDAIITAAQSLGVRPLILLNAPPDWAKTGSQLNISNYPDFVAFAVAALDRYASYGALTYEIFNEVNGSLNYPTFGSSAANYANLLQQTYTAMKAANPDCFILFSGLSANQTGDLYPRNFLDAVYTAIGQGYFDAMNHHPYGWVQAELDDLYTSMQSNGDGAKKIWLTEYGNYNGTASGAVDIATQAYLAKLAIRMKRAIPYAGPLFFYDYLDDGTDLADSEDNFGLTYADGNHKPIWVAIRDTIANG